MHGIFAYTIGDVTVHYDPLKVRRILLEKTDGRAWTYVRDLALMKQESEGLADVLPVETREAQQAVLRVKIARLEGVLAAATVEAFELSPFSPEDGSGWTEMAALTLLAQYMEFAAGKG